MFFKQVYYELPKVTWVIHRLIGGEIAAYFPSTISLQGE